MNWSDLIGKKVVAFRGMTRKRTKHTKKVTPLEFILFDDGETFIALSEQDYYTHHDCSQMARHLDLNQDAQRWQQMFDKDQGYYQEPDNVGSCPF